MDYSILLVVATFFVSLMSSILSGLASGGGGFIMAPWELLIGFSPAQMVATGSVGGSSIALGTLGAMRHGKVKIPRRAVVILSIISMIAGLSASWVVPQIDVSHFKLLTAILTLVALPLFFSRHARLLPGKRTPRDRIHGYLVMSLLIIGSAWLFSSIFGLLMALALPFFFGMSTMESTAVRRISGLAQMIVVAISMHQYILWTFVIATMLGGSIGSYIGTHIAIRRGDKFARHALAFGAVLSATALILH